MSEPWFRSPGTGFSPLMLSRIRAVLAVVGLTVLLWVVQGINAFGGGWLIFEFGIYPRSTDALGYIFTAPFIHGDLGHLVANSVPLLVLGSFAAFSGLGRFLGASLIIIVVSGLGVWFLGPPSIPTVGASGLIFGYFGYVVLRGIIERRLLDITLSIAVVLLYGGMILGALPFFTGPLVSWQAHLFGFIGGLGAAYFLPRRDRPAEQQRGFGSYPGYSGGY